MRSSVRRGVAAAAAVVLSTFGIVSGAQAAPPEAAVLAVPGAEVVPDSYLVVLKPGKVSRTGAAEHDATVLRSYRKAFNGFAATLTARQARG
ncbi:protease inhibitor I9 family protein [Actinoplanes derwentensis]|uniref:protease inhibitor I9 family protein n=1 Tax=Actinoplanes derwentensis TaxID=113562 RepID=UPI0018D39E9A|nr:protease inhibitor I9 family protein [Actinoplanes derwentensis]GID84766.1 hypothetical protein Ade03nite_36900 [Actinoplanes derwentensis]